MKSSILLCMLIVCLFFSGCTHEKLEPEYSQEETLIEGNSVSSVNVLAMAELQSLDDTQVIWGPGREVDDQNRPTACVKLQEEYGNRGSVSHSMKDMRRDIRRAFWIRYRKKASPPSFL